MEQKLSSNVCRIMPCLEMIQLPAQHMEIKQFQINDHLSKVVLPKQKVFKAKLEFFTQQ